MGLEHVATIESSGLGHVGVVMLPAERRVFARNLIVASHSAVTLSQTADGLVASSGDNPADDLNDGRLALGGVEFEVFEKRIHVHFTPSMQGQ